MKWTFPKCQSWEKNLALGLGDQLCCPRLQPLLYVFVILHFLLLIYYFSGFLFGQSAFHLCKFAEASAGTSCLCLCWRSSKEQPGFDFPTDLPVRGVVPSTQRFGTVTMLAQTQAEHPPPLFPGPWECNTLRTKSHFPFLSNFHTPAPLLPRLACPLKKGDWGDMRMTLSISPTFPIIPLSILSSTFYLFQLKTYCHFF